MPSPRTLLQESLPGLEPAPKARRVSLFRRGRIWQVRLWIGDQLHRRSTNRRRKKDARQVAKIWRAQLERRGKPARVEVLADVV